MARLSDRIEPDPVIEAYKAHVDRTLLRENLKLTPEQRLHKLQGLLESIGALRAAARDARPARGK